MSLGESKKKYESQVRNMKKHAKLILPKDLLLKIHYLHHKIKSIEWSGILMYKVESGTIEEPENLVLKVVDFALMDIGTSGYTEYDFKAEDDYMMDKLGEVMDKGLKIGHIHTHHSMNCFFSGVDMGELHENAPNHNYYLSLIVNFDSVSKWCAAIALVLEEEQIGEIKKVGTLKTITRYKNADGFQEKTIESNIDETDPINTKNSVLIKIDCDIEIEKDNEGHLVDRYIELTNKAKTSTNLGYQYQHNYERNYGHGVDFGHSGKGGGGQFDFPFCEIERKEEEEKEKEINCVSSNDVLSEIRELDCFSIGKVKPFLISLLGSSPDNVTMDGAMATIARESDYASTWQFKLGRIEERFQHKIDEYFKIDSDDDDAHCVAYTCIDILHPYHFCDKTKGVAKELVDLFTLYLTPKKPGINMIRLKLTGIMEDVKNDLYE